MTDRITCTISPMCCRKAIESCVTKISNEGADVERRSHSIAFLSNLIKLIQEQQHSQRRRRRSFYIKWISPSIFSSHRRWKKKSVSLWCIRSLWKRNSGHFLHALRFRWQINEALSNAIAVAVMAFRWEFQTHIGSHSIWSHYNL